MAFVRLKQRVPGKPRLPVEIDRGHWMVRDSVARIWMNEGAGGVTRDLISSEKWDLTGGTAWDGLAIQTPGGTTDQGIVSKNVPTGMPSGSAPFSMVLGAVMASSGNGGVDPRFSFWGTQDSMTASTVFANTSRSGNQGYLRIGFKDSTLVYNSGDLRDDLFHTVGIVSYGSTGGDTDGYLDGRKIGVVDSSGLGNTKNITATEISLGFSPVFPDDKVKVKFSFFYLFDRALTDAEVAYVSNNPYAPIRYRTITVPVSVSGTTVNADGVVVFDFRSALNADKQMPTDFTSELNADSEAPTEYLTRTKKDAQSPADWLSTIAQNAQIPSDWLLNLHVDGTAPIEHGLNVNQDGQIPAAHLANTQFDAKMPTSWRSALNLDGKIPIEHNSEVDADGKAILESLASLNQDGQLPASWLAEISADGTLPVEWTGGVLVTADAQIPVSWRQSINADGALNTDYLARLDADAKQPMDYLARINADATAIVDQLATVIEDAQIPAEWTGGVIVNADAEMPVEWRRAIAASGSIPIQNTHVIVTDHQIPTAFNAGVVSDQQAVIEWLQSISSDAEFPWQSITVVNVDAVIPIEWDGASAFVSGNVNVFTVDARGYVWKVTGRGFIWRV